MTIDYKPLANNVGANVESQAQLLLDLLPGGALVDGYKPGVAASQKVNKISRQSSVMTAAVATAISELLGGIDMLDDGDVVALTAKVKLAMTGSAWTTGDVKLTIKSIPDANWLMCDDGTIGSTLSTATHNNDANQFLFNMLWALPAGDTWAPVIPGRGASAAADWAANKKITMTRMLGRALAIAGAGSGLTARAIGQFLGEETHPLDISEIPSHLHGVNINTGGQSADHTHTIPAQDISDSGSGAPARWTSGGPSFSTGGVSNDHTHNVNGNTALIGGGGAHNNMQPTGFLNAMIKL